MRGQPIENLPLSPVDKHIEGWCITLLCISFVVAAVCYFVLPREVAISYSGPGADGFAGRMFLFLPVTLTAFLYLLLTVIGRYAYMWRDTRSETGEEMKLREYRRIVKIMRYMKLLLIFSFIINIYGCVRLLLQPAAGLSWPLYIVEAISIGIPTLYILYLLIKNRG
jgi:hypothetical protein